MKIDLGQDRVQQFYTAIRDAIAGVTDLETMTVKDERVLFRALVAALAQVVIGGESFDPESAPSTFGEMLASEIRAARTANSRN